MSLTRAATLAPTAQSVSQAQDPRPTEPTLPPHVQTFLGMIRTHFEAARDARPWDSHDTRAYGKVVLTLTGSQCRTLMDTLRTKHHWRPSVAQVQEALGELQAKSNPTAGLTDAEVKMRTVYSMPKALPSAANGPCRQRAREEMARKRKILGLTPEPKAENQVPATAPVSLVGMLAVALIEGRDIRGVVWSEEADRVQIKTGGGEKIWVDTIRVRLEVPVADQEYSAPNNSEKGNG